MKKIIIILVFLLSMVSIVIEVKADEELSPETETEQLLDITNDIEIRYKWYKEERVEGTYYLKGKTLKGYLEDKTITKYGKPIYDNSQICASPESYYNFSSSTSYGHSMIIEMRYVKLNKPINPNNKNNIDDKISTDLVGIFLLNNLPVTIAIKSLAIIPKIAPIISKNFADGYWIPKPIEERKVLSPISPTAIVRAIKNT